MQQDDEPPDVMEQVDLDRWFVHRGVALFRAYGKAVTRWEKTRKFEPPDPKELEVEDGLEFPKEAKFYGPGGLEKAIAQRVAKRTAREIAEAPGRPAKDQPRKSPGQGGLPAPEMLYYPKR